MLVLHYTIDARSEPALNPMSANEQTTTSDEALANGVNNIAVEGTAVEGSPEILPKQQTIGQESASGTAPEKGSSYQNLLQTSERVESSWDKLADATKIKFPESLWNKIAGIGSSTKNKKKSKSQKMVSSSTRAAWLISCCFV